MIMDKQCERKFCHNVGSKLYVSRTDRKGFGVVECNEHRAETITVVWDRFRRGN